MGAASSKNDDSIQGSVGGGNMNPYYLPGENTKGESSDRTGDGDQEDNYHLLGSAEEEREEGVRENVYHLVENPLDTEEDYADPDEEEMNNIYHVLEGPTPEWEEERERRDKAESEEEREREGVEREEPLTEPSAYEVPLSKHNSTVLQ